MSAVRSTGVLLAPSCHPVRMGLRLSGGIGPVRWSVPLSGRRGQPPYVEPYVGPGLNPNQVGQIQGPPKSRRRWGIALAVVMISACPAYLIVALLVDHAHR
jgi:hypothetical protein